MVRCERYSSRMTTRLAKLSGLGLASRPAYSSLRREAAAQAAYRRARLGGSSLVFRPSYSTPRCKAAAHAGSLPPHDGFRAGWPPGRPLPCAAVRGCGKLSFITHNRTTVEPTLELSIVRSTRRYSRHDNGCLPPGECAHDAARQARGGLGAFWPAHSALRCEATAQAASHRAMRLRAGLSAGPYPAGMRAIEAACHTRGSSSSRRLRLGLPACL